MDKIQKFQRDIDRAYQCKAIYEQLESDVGFSGNPRLETALRMGLSKQQADRYRYFAYTVPEVQNLVREGKSGLTNLAIIASHPEAEQREIYSILQEAIKDDCRLIRDAVNQIVYKYRDGLKTWAEIKPSCLKFIAHTTAPRERVKNKMDTNFLNNHDKQTGVDFEYWFADLLKSCGYLNVTTTPHSYDKGIDVTAQKDGIRYIFQCKHTKSVGIRALQEIWFAKNENDHVAVVVTTGNIGSRNRILADRKGIKYWTKKDLFKMYQEIKHSQSP